MDKINNRIYTGRPFQKIRSFRIISATSLLALGGLGGCGANHPAGRYALLSGASSFPVVGAYFPGWLICLVLGALSATLYRVLFLYLKIDAMLSFRLLTYISLGTVTGLILWIIFFAS